MKRVKYIAFVLVLGMGLLAACSSGDDEEAYSGPTDEELDILNEEGFPIVEDEISLEFFARQDPATNENWNDVFIYNEYEEMTNMDIQWKMVPNESVSEQMNLALGGGELPDVFHSTIMGSSTLMKYGKQ